jgi:hypothetical protein
VGALPWVASTREHRGKPRERLPRNKKGSFVDLERLVRIDT